MWAIAYIITFVKHTHTHTHLKYHAMAQSCSHTHSLTKTLALNLFLMFSLSLPPPPLPPPHTQGSWRKRWCVLSETADGIHLLYYKHHHSFTNCEAPVGVVLMEDCQKLYTIPNHSKSSHVFAVAFPHRIIMFHPDKG